MKQVFQEKPAHQSREIPTQVSSIVTSAVERFWLRLRVALDLVSIGLKHLGNPIKIVKVLRTLKKKYETVFGEPLFTKVAKVDGRYYWRMANPGFPSLAARMKNTDEMHRVSPFKKSNGLGILLFGITKKCPLSCEHCYEWDRMHQKEAMTTDDLVEIVRRYQAFGTTQIALGGGEPMLRINDVFTILENAGKESDFWVNTSGWRFDESTAIKLKGAGLTGVMISLDHFISEKHDAFRGRKGAFDLAINAALGAKKANLVTGLSLCPTKEFISEKNLRAYMELANKLGVTYVQFFEPKPAGRYKGKDISLSKSEFELLERIYLEYNRSEQYRSYPIINYYGYHQRRNGCFGGGDYYLYIDTDGMVHKCPVCHSGVSHALAFPVEDTVRLLKESGSCHFFPKSKY